MASCVHETAHEKEETTIIIAVLRVAAPQYTTRLACSVLRGSSVLDCFVTAVSSSAIRLCSGCSGWLATSAPGRKLLQQIWHPRWHAFCCFDKAVGVLDLHLISRQAYLSAVQERLCWRPFVPIDTNQIDMLEFLASEFIHRTLQHSIL